jgi:hypothetical protein
MVKLIRTRQGDYELGKNVIEWENLMSEDATKWEGDVKKTLRDWSASQSKSVGNKSA